MEGKKSFILYTDIMHTVSKLPDDKAGMLFKLILDYVNDKDPTTDDLLLQIAFEPIKQQLKRDLVAWRETSGKRSETGRLGGVKSGEIRRERKQNEAKEASASKLKQTEANGSKRKQNEHVTVNVTVTDNVNEIQNTNDDDGKVFINANNQTHLAKYLVIENKESRDATMMMYRFDQKVLEKYCADFNSHLTQQSKKHPTFEAWRKHFLSWLRIQIQNQTNNVKSGKNNMDGITHAAVDVLAKIADKKRG